MKKTLFLTFFVLFCLSSVAIAAEKNTGKSLEIAGIALGDNIKDLSKRVDMSTAMTIWDQPWLKNVRLKPTKGFRSGYVTYGDCANKGRIVRIKLNYDTADMDFFKGAVNFLAEKYGKPTEWKGNVAGTLKGFKWSVPDGKGNKVSMTLTLYQGDFNDITRGNSIRIAVNKWREEEKACWKNKRKKVKKPEHFGPDKPSEEWLLPH